MGCDGCSVRSGARRVGGGSMIREVLAFRVCFALISTFGASGCLVVGVISCSECAHSF